MYVSSINNEIIKETAKLKEKKYRDITNTFLIEGEHLVIEALKYNIIKNIFVLENTNLNFSNQIIVSELVMKKLSDNPSVPRVVAVAEKKENKLNGDKILILDRVQDPGNLGTIIRSSVAFNFDTIVLSNDTVDLYNPKVLRSTQGMIFNVNIIREDIFHIINDLKLKNYEILGTKVDGGILVDNYQRQDKFALIIGNEGQGINDKILPLCDKYLYINMNKKCESLNASIAASILMYELGGK